MVCNPKIIMLSLPQGILQLYTREMQNTSPNSFTVILFHFLKRYLTLITCHCNLCPDRHTLSPPFFCMGNVRRQFFLLPEATAQKKSGMWKAKPKTVKENALATLRQAKTDTENIFTHNCKPAIIWLIQAKLFGLYV